MKEVFNLESVSDYNKLVGVETVHPLVSIIDFSKTKSQYSSHTHLYFGIYAIYLKEYDCGELRYGRGTYDYQEGTLVFIAPGQSVEIMRKADQTQRKGWALMFHPDLIRGTQLGKNINEYTFFSYAINEALHISEKERKVVFDCFDKISAEIEDRLDKHSRKLIVNNIELFLDYCVRFYDRQFITRDTINQGVIARFDQMVNEYLLSDQPQESGLPSVSYFADKLNLSANYLGDLVKKESGFSAQDKIQLRMISLAKEMMFDPHKSISEIAYQLGFKYPQHFTRMFKKEVGVSPVEYRNLN
ncbi:MAG TPA: helix-turn-helix domain-containing protein [Prolixibacteraceae bacterium]|nr:helix-turn-helix domain-containing protein [Prolixibacteraceae bacterium]